MRRSVTPFQIPRTRLQKAAKLGVSERDIVTTQVVRFTIPLIPPSVNHYVKHTRRGFHYITKEAIAFKEAILLLCKQRLSGKTYEIQIWVYLGKGQRGDWDNFPKVVCDGLKDAGIVESDAQFKDGHVYVRRDRKNPRTEVVITVLSSVAL